jgi:hypothetical protein
MEHDMKSPGDLEISRRELLLGTAAFLALLAVPAVAALSSPRRSRSTWRVDTATISQSHSGLVKKKE